MEARHPSSECQEGWAQESAILLVVDGHLLVLSSHHREEKQAVLTLVRAPILYMEAVKITASYVLQIMTEKMMSNLGNI